MCNSHIAASAMSVGISTAFTIPRIVAFVSETSAASAALLTGSMIGSIGNVAAAVISLTAAILAKNNVCGFSYKAALIVTAVASLASVITSIVALVVLGAPVALIVSGVILSVVYGIANTASAYRTYREDQNSRAAFMINDNSAYANGVPGEILAPASVTPVYVHPVKV